MALDHTIWSMKVAVEEIPPTGMHFDLAAGEETRASLARAAGLRDLPRFEASFDVTRQGRDALHVTGEVSATVGQNCVVTLEPIECEVREPVDLVFAPPAEATLGGEGGEATMRFTDEEQPDALTAGSIDLGAIATEFLLLGVDPYPRKPGAEFEPPETGDLGSKPFAALAALKKRGS
jgi:hypothetical protein